VVEFAIGVDYGIFKFFAGAHDARDVDLTGTVIGMTADLTCPATADHKIRAQ
jgi:hypothetical protein